MDSKFSKAIVTGSTIAMLSAPSLSRADDQTSISNTITGTTKEYLSDPARTGSIVGSIIAGSAVANPLAPLLGSVVGFIIGKSSSFSDKHSNVSRGAAYPNRSLISESDLAEVASLTGLAGDAPLTSQGIVVTGLSGNMVADNPLEQAEPRVIIESPGETTTSMQLGHTRPLVMVELPDETALEDLAEQSDQVVSLGSHVEAGMRSELHRQLASQCNNVQLSQPMPMTCYYYSQ
ncbi:MAG: hypothetical protein AB8B64_08195 [Granulosicoccus sp.]